MGVPIKRPENNLWEKTYLMEVGRGLGVTMKYFFRNVIHRKDTATIRPPEGRYAQPPRPRGLHRLLHREDGSPRCVACFCCSTACPAECIHIEAGEYPDDDPRAGIEKYPVVFTIDELRCVFCGHCVEACPCDAIRMDTGLYVPPALERAEIVYEKSLLLEQEGRDGTQVTANPRS
jgi:NADH-quinone oxidoreductase subunit I